jgi:hypothetical protein
VGNDEQVSVTSPGPQKHTGLRANAFWFTVHSFAALPVGGIVSVLLTGAVQTFLEDLPARYRSLTHVIDWYGPYVCAVGVALGFVVNRRTLKRAACYVWIAGLTWLAVGIGTSVSNYDPRFYQGCSVLEIVTNSLFILNGRKCGGGGSTLAGVIFTMPAMNSVAYAVGAWIAMRLSDGQSRIP